MVIINEYDIYQKPGTDFFYVRSRTVSDCPFCNGKLKNIGSRQRKLRQWDGLNVILIIRRLRCLNCLHIHHELPDRIIPYKRYDADTVERVITTTAIKTSDLQPDYPCELSTALRLIHWFIHVLSQLCEMTKIIQQEMLHFFQIKSISLESFLNMPTGWMKKFIYIWAAYTCNA